MKIKEVTVTKEMKIGTYITCKVCGKQKIIRPCHKGKAKFCSYKCYWQDRRENEYPIWNKGMRGFGTFNKGRKRPDVARENNWKWNGGIKTYRKIAKENGLLKECRACGEFEKDKLLVHHKDENRYNNKIENLSTLCFKCHSIVHQHHNRWGNYENK